MSVGNADVRDVRGGAIASLPGKSLPMTTTTSSADAIVDGIGAVGAPCPMMWATSAAARAWPAA